MMDWTYPETNEKAGIFEIGRRLAEELGRAPDVTRFILPPEAAKPGLAERLRGMALDKLTAQLGAPVLVAL
jgi:hypothetical protein